MVGIEIIKANLMEKCECLDKRTKEILLIGIDEISKRLAFSKSEIVVPLIINQYIPLILDVDHDTYAHFNFIDETYLTQILQLIGSKHFENL